jgi:hypothetical protein
MCIFRIAHSSHVTTPAVALSLTLNVSEMRDILSVHLTLIITHMQPGIRYKKSEIQLASLSLSPTQGEQSYIRSGHKIFYVLESFMIVSDQTKYRTENRGLGSSDTNLVTRFNKIP